jgi:hypothetical protein
VWYNSSNKRVSCILKLSKYGRLPYVLAKIAVCFWKRGGYFLFPWFPLRNARIIFNAMPIKARTSDKLIPLHPLSGANLRPPFAELQNKANFYFLFYHIFRLLSIDFSKINKGVRGRCPLYIPFFGRKKFKNPLDKSFFVCYNKIVKSVP